MSELVIIEKVNAVEVFTGGGIDPLIEKITEEARALVPDTTTVKGRKEIASMAHKVRKAKVAIDGLGKDLVSDWKAKSKQVDNARKSARDTLDELSEEVRKPLDEWEAAEEIRVKAEALALEVVADHEAAIAENDLFNRQREIDRKEAELQRQEEERQAKEEVARIQREQEERDERLKKEAFEAAHKEAEAAKKAAAEAAKRELEEAERKEREAIAAKEQAERDKIAAEERAKIEKQQAIEAEQRKAKEEAEQLERVRLEGERIAREEAERKAANKNHQAKINREAKQSLIEAGYDDKAAQELIVIIAKGLIKNVTINY